MKVNIRSLRRYIMENDTVGDIINQEGQNTEEIKITKSELEQKLQSEADKRVTEALKTAESKWKAEFEAKLKTEKAEAERLARLSEEERYKEELKKKEAELTTREKAQQRRELEIDAINVLNERKLPVKFAKTLLADDAEGTLANINAFEKAWKAELDEAISQRLRGTTPESGGNKKKTLDMNQLVRSQLQGGKRK